MGDFLREAYNGNNEPHTTKKTLIVGLCVLALGAAFVGGVLWEYAAERQEIADIEAVALEACNIRVKNIQKLCR